MPHDVRVVIASGTERKRWQLTGAALSAHPGIARVAGGEVVAFRDHAVLSFSVAGFTPCGWRETRERRAWRGELAFWRVPGHLAQQFWLGGANTPRFPAALVTDIWGGCIRFTPTGPLATVGGNAPADLRRLLLKTYAMAAGVDAIPEHVAVPRDLRWHWDLAGSTRLMTREDIAEVEEESRKRAKGR